MAREGSKELAGCDSGVADVVRVKDVVPDPIAVLLNRCKNEQIQKLRAGSFF